LIYQGVISQQAGLVSGVEEGQHMCHLALANSHRSGVFNAPLLDADIDDPGKVIWQGKFCIGLNKQENNGDQNHGEVRLQIFEQFKHECGAPCDTIGKIAKLSA